MKGIFSLLLICFVVIVTVDGVSIGYDASSDSVIAISVDGVDAALSETSSFQIIIISKLQILYRWLGNFMSKQMV